MTTPKPSNRLTTDHLAPSQLKHGPQGSRLIPCERSQHHPHRPEHEDCCWCPPEDLSLGEDYYAWVMSGSPMQPWSEQDRIRRKGWQENAEQHVQVELRVRGYLPEWACTNPRALELLEIHKRNLAPAKADTIPAPPMPAPAVPNNWATIGSSTTTRTCIHCSWSFQGTPWCTVCPSCMATP